MTFNDMVIKQKAGQLSIAKSYSEEETDRLSDEFEEKFKKAIEDKFDINDAYPYVSVEWNYSTVSVFDYHGTLYIYVLVYMKCLLENMEYSYEKEEPLTNMDSQISNFIDDMYYEFHHQFEEEFEYEI